MKIENMEVYGIIYKITNKINGKCYIGQTKVGFNRRYNAIGEGIERLYNYHKWRKENNYRYNKHLFDSIKKYGFENFNIIEVLDIAFNRNELNEKEIAYIELYDGYKNGYNNSLGGDVLIHTDETKRKISRSNKGKIVSDESRRRMSISNSGRTRSEQAKNKQSETWRSTQKKIVQIDLDGNLVRVWHGHSEIKDINNWDTRSILGCCRKESKRFTSHGYIWMFYEDYLNNGVYLDYYLNNKNIKEIIQYDMEGNFIKEWKSISEASKELKIKDSDISQACKSKIKHAGYFKWEYKNLQKIIQ